MQKIILSALLLLCITGFSQSPFGTSKVVFDKPVYFFEMGGGALYSSYYFYQNDLGNYTQQSTWGKMGELSLRVQFKEKVSAAARFSFRQTGSYFPEFDQLEIRPNYINIFLPVQYEIRKVEKRDKVKPMLMVFGGPWSAFRVGGNVKTASLTLHEISQNQVSTFDAGFEAGLGFRIPTFSFSSQGYLTFKISAYQGLLNTLPTNSGFTEEQMKTYMLSDEGYRFSRGIRFSVVFEMSLHKKPTTSFTAGGDGKRTYKRFIVK